MRLRFGRQGPPPSRLAARRWGRRSLLGPLGVMLVLLAVVLIWREPSNAPRDVASGTLVGGHRWIVRQWPEIAGRSPQRWAVLIGPQGHEMPAIESEGAAPGVEIAREGEAAVLKFSSDDAVGAGRRFLAPLDAEGVPMAPVRFLKGVQVQ